MRDRMLEVADDLGRTPHAGVDAGKREAQEFLRWAAADHFTFLGYREYKVVRQAGRAAADEDSGLGLLRTKDGRASRVA